LLEEGWYLMSVAELERALILWKEGGSAGPVQRLTVEEALRFRDAGNVPDDDGRSLRLVLHVASQEELAALAEKRRRWEPDYLDAPTWRREGSKPVNVVPLRPADVEGWPRAWWDDDEVGPLEEEWKGSGTVSGITVPGEFRGFIFKTVIELRDSGRVVTIESIVDSLSRWLRLEDVSELERALRKANE
jgi:hypothetical protein